MSEEADGRAGVGAYSGSLSLSPSISSAAGTIKVCQDVVEARQLPAHYLDFWSQGDVLRIAVERVVKVHLTLPHSHHPPLPRRRLFAVSPYFSFIPATVRSGEVEVRVSRELADLCCVACR
jgi:hypothetical protein